MCPGKNESAGKHKSGRIRAGNTSLRAALGEAAMAATRTKKTYLSARYRRLTARRGYKDPSSPSPTPSSSPAGTYSPTTPPTTTSACRCSGPDSPDRYALIQEEPVVRRNARRSRVIWTASSISERRDPVSIATATRPTMPQRRNFASTVGSTLGEIRRFCRASSR
ncbi:hypothetical protein DLJ59_05135 [Micromonospora inaquosa]|uniref:Transposase IS116/IS110/IS902 C-terminal domain-containing protein n=1 Tax=Micromonospora inaquosa TaxID=2203716 RepID=A0A3N9WZY1_9ACTN|nr:hypothetical protein DLJ59_05135 [Micromonospora inaquosa]